MSTNRKSDTTTHRLQIAGTCFVAVTVTLAAASCGSDANSSAGSASPPPATGDTAKAQTSALGTILVDGEGRTMYQFANDKDGKSTCAAACAANWPFVPAPASLPTSLPGVTGKLGTTTRDGGAHQLTVAGHPLYTFVGDSTPGQTNGQGINLNGGVWTVVSPGGAPVTSPNPAGTSTQKPLASGY